MNIKFILTLCALALWVFFCQRWWCNHKDNCPCNTNTEASAVTTASGDDGIIKFNTNEFNTLLGSNWAGFSDSIANLIKGGKRVEITGFYSASETNNSKYENLGIARADTIKDLLMAKLPGISAGRFNLRGALKEDLGAAPFIASNLSIMDTIATPDADGGVVVLDSNNIIIYFPSGSSAKEASKEVDDYLKQLAPKLQASGKNASITGHTDNKGKFESNLKLSKDRAEFVKSILVKDGVTATQLSTEGKADKEPVGDNNTDAGRKQNRRVTIQIK